MKFTIGHLFSGIGGSALGAAAASARFGDAEATFETVGGVDFDPLACFDFERLTGAPALCGDMHTLQPADLRAAWGPRAPDAVMASPPCKGFSGLLSAARAAEAKYQTMNRLLLDGLFLVCSAWDDPPALIFIENVPRIQTRGKHLVDQARQLLEAHGYAVAMGNHDCGELGELAQHRRRWFLLARHRGRVPQMIYQPPTRRVRACGEVLGPLPMPGDVEAAGPMHSVSKLSWRNWVRLALIPAGGDWRDLPGVVPEGKARREVHRRAKVAPWETPADTVTGPGGSAAGAVADPRPAEWFRGILGVKGWDEPAATVTGAGRAACGAAAVADPRFTNIMQVGSWDAPARTVIGATRVGSGAISVADPRGFWQRVAGVTPWTEPAPTITGGAKIHAGAFQVADPRVGCSPRAGAYRVLRWEEAAGTITGALSIDNGPAAVADPRIDPDRPPPFTPMIIAADGTWHRPLTTLELAALQGFPLHVGGEPLVLAGRSHTRWRAAIGNAVPPPAAEAIAVQLLTALLVSKLGAFAMSSHAVWVGPQPEVA